MECTTGDCPSPPCPHDGPRGGNAPRVRCGAERGLPRRRCPTGQGPWAVRPGPASCGGRAEEPPATRARRAWAAGQARRGTGRLVAGETETGGGGLERAGRPGRAVPAWRCAPWPRTAGPGAAFGRVGRQPAAPRTGAAPVLALAGAAWGGRAGAPGGRLGAALVVGPRAQERAHGLFERRPAVRGRSRPCWPREPWPPSPQAWWPGAGTPERLLPLPGPRGPPPPPAAPPPCGLARGPGRPTPAQRACGRGDAPEERGRGSRGAGAVGRVRRAANAPDPWWCTPHPDVSPGPWAAVSSGAQRRPRADVVRATSLGALSLGALRATP
jgi:hypothetical protein